MVQDICNNEFQIRQYCNYTKPDFPGSQPVSLSRLKSQPVSHHERKEENEGNIQHLAELEYMVSWKADGLRYLILIEGRKVYAFDRGNNVFEIPRLTFPRRKTDPKIPGIEYLRDTLLVFLVCYCTKNLAKNIPK